MRSSGPPPYLTGADVAGHVLSAVTRRFEHNTATPRVSAPLLSLEIDRRVVVPHEPKPPGGSTRCGAHEQPTVDQPASGSVCPSPDFIEEVGTIRRDRNLDCLGHRTRIALILAVQPDDYNLPRRRHSAARVGHQHGASSRQ